MFKATGIWPFNPKPISSDRLDPSLAIERFNFIPSPDQSPFVQPSQPVMPSPQPTTKPTVHSHYTRINFTQLVTEHEMLKKEVESLKVELTSTQEELGIFKSPGTSSLRSILK